MRLDDLDVSAVAAAIDGMASEFDTKELARHPRVLAAHGELVSDRSFDTMIGRLLGRDPEAFGVERTNARDASPARWRRIDFAPPSPPSASELAEREAGFRRRRFEQLVASEQSDSSTDDWWDEFDDRVGLMTDFLAMRAELESTRDEATFRKNLDSWSKTNRVSNFSGASGQMFLNQLVSYNDGEHDVADLLLYVTSSPDNWEGVEARFARLLEYCGAVKRGGNPAPRRSQFFLSYFWHAAEPDRWPTSWTSAESGLVKLGWRPPALDPLQSYRASYDSWRQLDTDVRTWEITLNWFDHTDKPPLDPTLVDRSAWAVDLDAHWIGEGYASEEVQRAAEDNSRVLVRAPRTFLDGLAAELSELTGREVDPTSPTQTVESGRYRRDSWVDGRMEIDGATFHPALRLWANHRGIGIGLRAGHLRDGWYDEVTEALRELPPGYAVFNRRDADGNDPPDVDLWGSPYNEPFFLRWFDGLSLFDAPDHRATVLEAMAAVRTQVDLIHEMAEHGEEFDKPSQEAPDDESDQLGELAEELFVDREFLQDVEDLLREKGQIVLYGPPGTGKTYSAKKLAAVLANDPGRHTLVQFHPSTSYEDFFEGYRPTTDAEGNLSYRLTPGPLARMAARAAATPGETHVMVIDEINRANLPKVFGELLFLLEYRNEEVSSLYRPEASFALPKNLLFIGTMNTADRSIALIDAALRRRFHFIGFFPDDDEGPVSQLLARWLEAEPTRPDWVAEFVAFANGELIDALGGPHLQIGPSFFMQKDLAMTNAEERVARIWKFNIFPFIEDQLFGEQARIDQFTFPAVWERYRTEIAGFEDADAVGLDGEGDG